MHYQFKQKVSYEGQFCRDCGKQMFSQDVSIQIDSATGTTMFVVGSWLQYLEDKIPVEMHCCPKCCHIEFYATEHWIDSP